MFVGGECAARAQAGQCGPFGNQVGHVAHVLPPFRPAKCRYTRVMPSFDIVSKINSMEVENAVSQAKKELATRFDFKDSKAEITLEKHEIKLTAPDAYKMKTLVEIVLGKLAKRGISTLVGGMCETDFSGYPDCRKDTLQTLAKALAMGMDRPFTIETPLMSVMPRPASRAARPIRSADPRSPSDGG